MSDIDPSRDQETKAISITPADLSDTGPAETDTAQTGVVILPDGTKPIKMGSGYITGILGEGGMSIVYEIWNEQLGVKRAVKLLRPNSSQENIERFEREIKVTAQLDHPNIIDIHAVGEWNGLPYIEMEMIDGISLSELITRQGTLPLEVCTSIAIIVCRALIYTHYHEYKVDNQPCIGLLHRDLKPGNILFSREGIVRLTDFGVATPTNVAPSTSSGKVVGSMQYLAPEQLEEDDVDTRADIFSLGCILYEMLSGEKTFPDRNITRLVRKRLKNEFKPLSSFENLSVPPKLDDLINECLQLNPAKRPADIKVVMHQLEKIHSGLTLKSPEAIITAYARGESFEEDLFLKRKRFPMWAIAGIALATFCVVAVGVYFMVSPTTEESETQPQAVRQPSQNIAPQTQQQRPAQIPQQEPIKNAPSDTDQSSGAASTTSQDKTLKPTQERLSKSASSPVPAKPAPVKKQKTPSVTSSSVSLSSDGEDDLVSNVTGPETLLTKMQKKYKTTNMVTILTAEDADQNYTNVINICKLLPPAQAGIKEIRLLKHRALVGTNKVNKSYFDNNHINDGEFYLSKAKFLYDSQQYQRAIWILGIIRTSPTLLMDKKTLNREVLYYMAKCNTGIFNGKQTLDKQKSALQSWFDVKNEFRVDQDAPYFIEANNEIRRISKIKLEAETESE